MDRAGRICAPPWMLYYNITGLTGRPAPSQIIISFVAESRTSG